MHSVSALPPSLSAKCNPTQRLDPCTVSYAATSVFYSIIDESLLIIVSTTTSPIPPLPAAIPSLIAASDATYYPAKKPDAFAQVVMIIMIAGPV